MQSNFLLFKVRQLPRFHDFLWQENTITGKGNYCLQDCLNYSKSRGESSLLNEPNIGYSPWCTCSNKGLFMLSRCTVMKKQLQNEATTWHPSPGEQEKKSRWVSVEQKRGCGNARHRGQADTKQLPLAPDGFHGLWAAVQKALGFSCHHQKVGSL